MDVFVQGIAALSGVRDRDALDAAFVRLVLQTTQDQVQEVSLLRIVGEGEDRRCLVRAHMRSGSDAVDCDPIWQDWSLLPKLSTRALHAQVFAGQGVCAYSVEDQAQVFLVVGEQGPWGLLELKAHGPLPPELERLVAALIVTYQNVLGLLDYGEKDALTELLNRKTFDGAFFKATADQGTTDSSDAERRSSEGAGDYWLAVLDIDHFKRVNDSFGHLIGDEVLLLVARIMRNSFRFHDQLYRFGGEEFVILMRCRELQDAAHALERLRHNVEHYVFPQVGTITVSIGFSGLHPHDTPGAAFGRADKAVYHAKSHGRNQVVNYEDLVQSGAVQEKTDDMDVDLF
ncbi:GGDEF domain-containing protein [Curvibacter sp. APW13]|uniref:GGDEF domain-containing protein n=1 Tax=Curvibacter sp. APW13 TaxID=3077236 RepID=UPI0028E02D02|nr:GGDEF domain-containing protein [Curvibacter sp. APW13]MDT8991880.1 GGDEF domain-containing protein [Curvibacter sp. APW13]